MCVCFWGFAINLHNAIKETFFKYFGREMTKLILYRWRFFNEIFGTLIYFPNTTQIQYKEKR